MIKKENLTTFILGCLGTTITLYFSSFYYFMYCLFGGFLFAFIEYSWTYLSSNEPGTTFHQFIISTTSVPIFHLFFKLYQTITARVLLFPFLIWAIEIIFGFYYILSIGYNPAWVYETKYSYFSKTIRIDYYPLWSLLGIFFGFLFDNLLF